MAAAKKRRKSGAKKKTKKAQVRSSSRSSKESLESLRELFSGSRVSVWFYEVSSLACTVAALFLIISVISYQASGSEVPAENVMGPSGHLIATVLFGFLGWCAVVPAVLSGLMAVYFWYCVQSDGEAEIEIPSKLLFCIGLTGSVLGFCGLAATFWGETGGGVCGVHLSRPLVRLFGEFGAALICLSFILFLLGVAFQKNTPQLLGILGRSLWASVHWAVAVLPTIIFTVSMKGLEAFWNGMLWLSDKLKSGSEADEPEEDPVGEKLKPARRRKLVKRIEQEKEEELVDGADATSDVIVKRRKTSARLIAKAAAKRKERQQRLQQRKKENELYKAPALELLTPSEVVDGDEDDELLKKKSRMIAVKLADFGIRGKVTKIHPGPVITLFEFKPSAGIKVGKIASLQDDLAMSLKATSIRIIAPIPGKDTVGIEVPNRQRDLVRLRDVLESEEFNGSESSLTVGIGKDIYGTPMVADIAKMPHFLMAGATGTGKSVSINALLISLLYRCTPAELGLILIDPKILELSIYEGIPHLKVPVVTVPRQARAVLEWAVKEMNRRYRLMQKYGVRNIDGFNRVASGEEESDKPEEDPKIEGVFSLKEEQIVEEGTVEGDDASQVPEQKEIFAEVIEPLPKIVIVIDELADLMLSVGKDIENLITRLAQKARAAGIHLIVATQRPSVDVITGLIKANFPARMSFKVASRVDSRTILDQMGADKLLGRGDMLLMLPGGEGITRAHGAYVSDQEVKDVISAIRNKGKPHYDEEIVKVCEKALEDEEGGSGGSDGDSSGEYDAMYDKAVELVVVKGEASTSMIQREFRIGYNRAARIIDTMEQEGVVGPANGAKRREVLLDGRDYDA